MDGREITRRRFLFYAGAGSGLLVAGDVRGAPHASARESPVDLTAGLPSFTRTVRRRADLFAATFEFRNLRLTPETPRRLVKVQPNAPAYLIVELPPQHLADEAFGNGLPFEEPGNVQTRLARPTRLAFQIPADRLPLPYTLASLLNWVRFAPRLVPVAGTTIPPGATIRPPNRTETAIEMPWRLVLSPLPGGRWAHAVSPVTRAGRSELWHTRLGVPDADEPGDVDEVTTAGRVVRAVHERDPVIELGSTPRLSLSRADRRDIVQQSSNRSLGASRRDITVDRLMLSPLGGWLDVHANWPDEDLPVAAWRHRVAMGRDSYVRVVRRGFLLPYGHPAAAMTITERRFVPGPGGHQRAYLEQRLFVVVRQPVRAYGGSGHPAGGRGFPFRSVRIATLTTPDLDLGADPAKGFVPKAGGRPVLFDLVGTDWAGRETEFDSPLTFLPVGLDQAQVNSRVVAYNNKPLDDPETARERPVKGQKVAFAPQDRPGDTTFDVAKLRIGAQPALSGDVAALAAAGQATFFPVLQRAALRLPAAEQLSGQVLGEVATVLDKAFVDHGFDAAANAGQVFLKVVSGATGLSFSEQADKVGALVTPDLSITGVTRRLGPVGGALEDLAAGKFDPAQYLGPAAKLLGATRLIDILLPLTAGQGGATGGPRIQTVLEPKPLGEPPALPQRVITTLDWTPKLKKGPLGIVDPGTAGELTLNVELTTELVTAASTFVVKGDFRDFTLNLIGEGPARFLQLDFKKLSFVAVSGAKPDFDYELGEIRFLGVLRFVEEFRNFLSSLGQSLPVDATPRGIEVSLTLPLPRIAVGVFTMQNMSIGIGAIIPFNGDAARFRFNFCTRENPFVLTISMFGGGGFFGLEVGTDRSVMLEVALEFGASIAFDIGVASGGVEVMAGIYLKVVDPPGSAELTGYLRMGGELSVLGIIRIACELYLGFTYVIPDDKCVGRATFHLEIEILIFSFTVSAEVERRFGGEGDPTFAQMMKPGDWAAYADAYAPLGAP